MQRHGSGFKPFIYAIRHQQSQHWRTMHHQCLRRWQQHEAHTSIPYLAAAAAATVLLWRAVCRRFEAVLGQHTPVPVYCCVCRRSRSRSRRDRDRSRSRGRRDRSQERRRYDSPRGRGAPRGPPGPPGPLRAPPKELTMFIAGLGPQTHERVSDRVKQSRAGFASLEVCGDLADSALSMCRTCNCTKPSCNTCALADCSKRQRVRDASGPL
jgi:hypothetical protein